MYLNLLFVNISKFLVSFQFNYVKFTFVNSFDSNFYLVAILSFCFYIISICGLLFNLKNILISLFFIELTYFSMITFILLVTVFFYNFHGFILALITLLLAAAESAVGLGLVIVIYSAEKRITYDNLIELR